MYYVFHFQLGVYFGTLNIHAYVITSIPDLSILTVRRTNSAFGLLNKRRSRLGSRKTPITSKFILLVLPKRYFCCGRVVVLVCFI